MFLRFFGLGIFDLEVSERHVQRLVNQPDSDGVVRRSASNSGCRG